MSYNTFAYHLSQEIYCYKNVFEMKLSMKTYNDVTICQFDMPLPLHIFQNNIFTNVIKQ